MWDTCTSHFGPKKFDRVGRGGQGRSKYCPLDTPLLKRSKCWGKTILPRAGYRLGTYRTVDIFNFSLISWTILEKKRFLCFYIIKSSKKRTKIPLSSHWFYNVKTQKTQFLQNSSWEMAEIENIHCPICTQPIPSSWQNGLPPALATSVQRGAERSKLKCSNI